MVLNFDRTSRSTCQLRGSPTPIGSHRRVFVSSLLLIAIFGSIAFVTPAAATPTLDCADAPDAGVPYVTDTGFEVVDHTSIPPSENGPFVNNSTIRRGNVTFAADDDASVHLENATATTVCLGALNATTTPVRVTIDGTDPVLLEGKATAVALGPIAYDHEVEGVDLAYEANDSLVVRLPSTDLDAGTAVKAVDADGGSVRTEGTVDQNGALDLTLPAGRAAVDVTTVPPPTTSPPAATSPPEGTQPGTTGTETGAPPTTTEALGPGFGLLAALVAVAMGLILQWRG